MGHVTFTQLFEGCVTPIMAHPVGSLNNSLKMLIRIKLLVFFLDVHRLTLYIIMAMHQEYSSRISAKFDINQPAVNICVQERLQSSFPPGVLNFTQWQFFN